MLLYIMLIHAHMNNVDHCYITSQDKEASVLACYFGKPLLLRLRSGVLCCVVSLEWTLTRDNCICFCLVALLLKIKDSCYLYIVFHLGRKSCASLVALWVLCGVTLLGHVLQRIVRFHQHEFAETVHKIALLFTKDPKWCTTWVMMVYGSEILLAFFRATGEFNHRHMPHYAVISYLLIYIVFRYECLFCMSFTCLVLAVGSATNTLSVSRHRCACICVCEARACLSWVCWPGWRASSSCSSSSASYSWSAASSSTSFSCAPACFGQSTSSSTAKSTPACPIHYGAVSISCVPETRQSVFLWLIGLTQCIRLYIICTPNICMYICI